MSMDVNPRIASNGLVFSIDAENLRSYAGPPIRNIATMINQNIGNQSNSTFSVSNGTENVLIPSLGVVNSRFVDMYNDYNGGSGECCPSPYGFGTDMTTSGSTLHTYALVYKSVNGYTHPNFMYRYEYNGPTYLLEGGVFDTSKRIHLGDDWYWAWNTFTTNASTTRFNYCGYFMYEYARFNRLYVANVLIAQGDYTTLHPSRWPAVNTTRANTAVISDQVRSSTVSATDLTYASNGSFSFNGSSNFIRFNNNTALDTQTPTVEVWVRTNSLNQNGFWFEKGSVNTQYSLFQEGTAIQWRQRLTDGTLTTLSTASSFISTSNWAHVVATYATGSRILYVNGVQVNSDSQTGTIATNNSGMFVGEYGTGAYRYNGSIGAVRVYNRVLTADEVRRNFNAQRSRYGV